MKKWFLLIIVFSGIFALLALGYVFDMLSSSVETPPNLDGEPYIEISFEEEVSLVGGVVEEWMKWETSATDLYNNYRESGRIYTANAVVINWGIFAVPEGTSISTLCFELSEDSNFENTDKYNLSTGKRHIELCNLFVDTEYYFRITVELSNGNVYTEQSSFKTKWSPRIIEFENLRNIRDVGGWKTIDGKTIKQGLVYRGCELDGAKSSKYILTQSGLDTMLNDLSIKTELDLRTSSTEGAKDMLGPGVKHQYVSFLAYSEIFTSYGSGKMKEVFEFLSDKENYPVYLHCSYGADRTGTVCYVLQALLGVSEEDCYRDWELSILTNGGAFYEDMEIFRNDFSKLAGKTLREKAENYLLSIGITMTQIESIREMLLEEYIPNNTDTD